MTTTKARVGPGAPAKWWLDVKVQDVRFPADPCPGQDPTESCGRDPVPRPNELSFVFTGDIGREVERTIAPTFTRSPIRILKVPHHGSATSSSQFFLDTLRPDIAVISAGRGNPFGHPAPTVLERYRNVGAAIYRTDKDGAVTVETDGTTVRIFTFNGRRLTLTTYGR